MIITKKYKKQYKIIFDNHFSFISTKYIQVYTTVIEGMCKRQKSTQNSANITIPNGAVNYNKAYNNELDIDSYNWITNYLDNYYMLDEGQGQWNNLITNYINENVKLNK